MKFRKKINNLGRYRWFGCLPAFACVFTSIPAEAHIKWFEPYDLTKPMLPANDVLSAQFVQFFLVSFVLIYAFFWIDRYVFRHKILEEKLRRYTVSDESAFQIMRWSSCAFFTSLSIYGLIKYEFYLTPELTTSAAWVLWLQAAIALCALNRRTVPLMGVGITVLYSAAAHDYGVYHLLDYLIFTGVAYFLIASRQPGPGWIMSRYIVLYATTGLTMLWGAIEKWAYPSWTYPLLQKNPDMLIGFSPHFYLMAAGFVEFNLTFVLLSSASLLSRTVALGLCSIFMLAIFKFGMIDAVGHLLFMAVFIVLIVRGPTKGRDFLVLQAKSLWTEAYFMTGLYCLAFNIMFLAYYGLHYLAYGN